MRLSNPIPTPTGPASRVQPAPDAEPTSVPAGQRLSGAPRRNRTARHHPYHGSLTAVPTCDDPGWEPPQVRQLWEQFRRPCDDPPGGSHPEAGGVPWGCQAQMGIVVVPCAAAGSWTFALDSRASVPCLHPQYPGQSRWPVGGGRSPPRHPLLPRDQRSQWDRDPLRRPEKDPRNFDACPADRVGGECLRHWAAPPAPTDASSPSPEAALNASRQPQTQPA